MIVIGLSAIVIKYQLLESWTELSSRHGLILDVYTEVSLVRLPNHRTERATKYRSQESSSLDYIYSFKYFMF